MGGYLSEERSFGLKLTGAILGGVGLLLLLWARSVGRARARARAIVATGLSGIAKIESVTQTGVVLNEINPQVEMDLEIHVEAATRTWSRRRSSSRGRWWGSSPPAPTCRSGWIRATSPRS